MIDDNTVKHVANLAKIEVDEDEIQEFRRDFERIIEFFNRLDEIDPDVEPTYNVIPLKNIMRKDEPGQTLERDRVLANAKFKENGYFKGPRVVE